MSGSARVFAVDVEGERRSMLVGALTAAELDPVEFDTAESLLDAWQPDWSGCLVANVQLPGVDGLCLQRRLTAMKANIGVVFTSLDASVKDSVRAMRAGAIDFFVEPVDVRALVATVKETLGLVEARQASWLAHRRTLEDYWRLRPREREVLHLLLDSAGALTSKELARTLGLSPRTVEHYRAGMLAKMHAESLTEVLLRTSEALATSRLAALPGAMADKAPRA